MYKTVRQGENSLQYHILPQDDHQLHPMTKRRQSSASRDRAAFILVITLILGCAMVAAAVLIPALMASNVVALPGRFQTFAVAAKAHGKYSLQGAQYIALLPVKDQQGHYNAYQLKPSLLTALTTSTTTTSSSATPEGSTPLVNSDPHRPHNTTTSKGLPWWIPTPFMPWMEHKNSALVLSLGVAFVIILAAASVGLYIFLRRRAPGKKGDVERNNGSLLVEGSGEDD